VTLTVNGPGGSDTETKLNLIVVSPPPTGDLVLGVPLPGTAGVNNTFTVTGCTPNSIVGFYVGQRLGTNSIVRTTCPLGVQIGLGSPFRLLGAVRANASGVATLISPAPATSAGKTFYFQVVDQIKCQASNLVTEVF
jgi:PKD repeat protein